MKRQKKIVQIKYLQKKGVTNNKAINKATEK